MTIYMYHLENNQQLLNHSQALQKFIEHHEPGKAFSLSILDAIETEWARCKCNQFFCFVLQVSVTFTWQDAFDKGSFFGGGRKQSKLTKINKAWIWGKNPQGHIGVVAKNI